MKELIKDIQNKLGNGRADKLLKFAINSPGLHFGNLFNYDTHNLHSAEYIETHTPMTYKYFGNIHKSLLEIEDILKNHNYTAYNFIWCYSSYRYGIMVEYNKKPLIEKKDNKDYVVGGGGDNRNKIRYPKKCRKTAWKRFYKLFPHLKPTEE